MFRAIILAAAFVSASAFACPDLTGNYTCTYGNGQTEDVAITQEVREGVTYFKYNNDEFAADGREYTLADSAELKEGKFSAWCEDVTLKNKIVGKYYNNGSYFGDLTMIVDITKSGTSINQAVNGSLKSSNGEYPINQTVTCTAK